MELYDAIFKRKSTREYSINELSENEVERIKNEVTSVDKLFEDSKIGLQILHYEEVEDFISGLVGTYGKIEAPHYILASSQAGKNHLVNLGYTLEKIVLEITRMEIGTCWMGSHFDKDDLKENFVTDGELVPTALIAFGNSEKDVLRSNSEEAGRKELSEIILKGESNLSEDWSDIIDAARMAPSAMNSQPWRFEIEENSIHIYIKSGEGIINKLGKTFGNLDEMNKIDGGIALRHIQIAADHFSEKVRFERIDRKRKNDLSYIISVTGID